MTTIRFLGHAGFKISTPDPKDGSTRVIYVDAWLGAPNLPEDLKGSVPDDADLFLISHGHFDHSGSAADIIKASKKPNPVAISNYELIGGYLVKQCGVPAERGFGMNKGGTADFGFCKITAVSADHSSGCPGHEEGTFGYGGNPMGFVITLADTTIYHAGDTNVFLDMELINDLYSPKVLLLPIGSRFTMGPSEAAYSVSRFFKKAHTVVPMHFATFPLLTGTFEEFVSELERWRKEFGRDEVKVIDSRTLFGPEMTKIA